VFNVKYSSNIFSNCSLYWICNDGDATLRECPPGLIYDPDLTTCNIETEVECPWSIFMPNKKPLCPLGSTQNIPHSSECNAHTIKLNYRVFFYPFLVNSTKYWFCQNGTPKLKQCASGSFFHAIFGECVKVSKN
jgi:hypothetical protein